MLAVQFVHLRIEHEGKCFLALGRPSDEIAEWLNGEGTIDGDALMKVQALERERK